MCLFKMYKSGTGRVFFLFAKRVHTDMWQVVCQCLPPTAPPTESRGEFSAAQVSVQRVHEGLQVQASPQGTQSHSFW